MQRAVLKEDRKVGFPTREDLQNRPVSLWRRELSNRYSRNTVIIDGYRFVYDNKDKCWRPLKARRLTKADKDAARALSSQKRDKAKARQNQRRAFVRKHLSHNKLYTPLRVIGLGWTKNATGLVLTIAAIVANAIILPFLPIVAITVGGLIAWGVAYFLVFVEQVFLKGADGFKAIAFRVVVALSGIAPLYCFWTLHSFIARSWHGS